MKSIGLLKNNCELLKQYSNEPLSYDGIINRLIHDVADKMPITNLEGHKNSIRVHDDTVEKLKAYQLTRSESYENIILRMLITAQKNKEGE